MLDWRVISMSHEWDAGVLNESSWHGLEKVGVMPNASAMIAAGETSGAWPTVLRVENLVTVGGIKVPNDRAIVGSYASRADRVLGVVGDRFRATACDEGRDLVRAACEAGATPTGAFSLRGGSRVLATFEVGLSNGLKTNLLIADAFDGTMKLTCGFTSIRVVCANTLAASMKADRKDMAAIRHTASLESKVQALQGAIASVVEDSGKVREKYEQASKVTLTREMAVAVFDKLFPPAPQGASQRAQTMAENARIEARRAMENPINKVGYAPGNLATLWNGATWDVDRTAEGKLRPTRGDSDELDSLLFGARAQRLVEINNVIDVVLRSGEVQRVSGQDAIAMGVPPQEVGRKFLEELMAS